MTSFNRGTSALSLLFFIKFADIWQKKPKHQLQDRYFRQMYMYTYTYTYTYTYIYIYVYILQYNHISTPGAV